MFAYNPVSQYPMLYFMISSSVKPLFFTYDRACLAVNDLSFNMDLYSSGNTTLISSS
jgi:hypothetical protein